MILLFSITGVLLAFIGATGPAYMFLIPRLDPALWYRFDLKRTVLVVLGNLIILGAYLMDTSLIWPLFFLPITAGLRAFLRPHRVIRALDTPRHLPAAQADLPPDSYVLALEIEGQSRAWPREVLIAHHLIHDKVGELPLLACW
jgi:hypothetical protein